MIPVTLHENQIEIPDPLTRQNGERVSSTKGWQQNRRPELLELFRTHVYGRAPLEQLPLKLDVTNRETDALNGAATRQQITLPFSGRGGAGAIRVLMFVPNGATRPAPCFVTIDHRGAADADPKPCEFWPAEQLIARGYATAIFNVADLDPDFDDGFKNGVHGVFDEPGARACDAWGTIAAWAWGANRVSDYLQTEALVDKHKIALVGHSRGGKTALWAGAQDERWALVVANNSGSTGAALSRGKQGERIARINASFPHWFCENYKRFGDKEAELPVDQHQLLALIAPRPLYVASATQDSWSDPEAEWQSARAATPVYQLFGLGGVRAPKLPAPETPLLDEHIGFHLRTGKHDLTPYDWARFMDFADRHFDHVDERISR